jgi:hypothetical protein
MKKLLSILFGFLPNAAHYDYCCKVAKELGRAGEAVKVALAALIIQFNDWLAKEDALMLWIRKSELTAQIAEADNSLDRSLSAVAAQVNAALYSSVPAVHTAAERLDTMLANYGDVKRKPYNVQEGAVRAVLEHFDGGYAADVTAVGLSAWIAELRNAYNVFAALLENRDTSMLEKPHETFAVVRSGIQKVYHQIVTLVNAGAALGVSADFGDFIDSLNPEIERLNRQFHTAKHDISKAKPASIPDQAYTGLPVTPLPEVLYVTAEGTVKLVLGKDYNLTYRDNINVGSAECTIHGKGAYRDSKTVTFIIKRGGTN